MISSSVKHEQEPPHLHRAVQASAAFAHLQFARQTLVQPQRSSSLHTLLASGRLLHTTSHFHPSVPTQPHPAGRGSSICGSIAWLQQCPAWYAALLACWRSAPFVGGMLLTSLPFLANRSNLTIFTSLPVLVLSYKSTTNLSIVSIAASTSPSCGCFFISDANCPVIYGYMLHVSHAVRLPLPEKHETVSPPVNAWNIGCARHLSSPIAAHILWAGSSL